MIRIKRRAALLALSAAVFAGGCAAKDTESANAVRESGDTVQESQDQTAAGDGDEAFDGKADMESIKDYLKTLTSHTRASGTAGEQQAAEEIKALLEQMGYETSLQPFEQPGIGEIGKSVKGTNVVAVKRPEQNADTADILYITAHHDAKAGIEGAEDDASGVAVLLETARLLGSLPTDTELRFVTFGGEEDGRVGSRLHVEGLTEAERSRIIGDIQLDDLGYWGCDYLELGTVDKKAVLLGDMLSEKAEHTRNMGRNIPYVKEEMSDHNPFHSHGIPAVTLQQDAFAFENHTTQDRIGILDPKRLQQTAQLMADIAADIMSEKTGSLLQKAYEGRRMGTAYEVQADTMIQFDMDRNFVENMMGLSGTLISSETDEFSDLRENYRYPVVWFGMEEPLDTLFQYRNGYLEMIEIPAQDALGADIEQVRARMEAVLGEPETAELEDYNWGDLTYHKFYTLEPAKDSSCHVLIFNYSLGKESRAVYDLSNGIGTAKETAKEDTDKKLLELLDSIIYPEDLPLIQFNAYTDGKSFSTGYTGAFRAEDNTQMDYALDYKDAFDENGEYREFNKTVCTAVHEYGHVISLNKKQVDITRQDESMPRIMFDKETYAKDAYIRKYYERFWKDLDVRSGLERYKEHPDEFVSGYGASDLSEDFAESFMLFVLSSKPEDDSLASEKIRFFYDYGELIARRDYIRGNLGIAETSGKMAPELAEGNYRIVLGSNPTTGYTWLYTVEPEGIVSEAYTGFFRNYYDRDLVGAEGTFLLDFTGIKEGTANVSLTYERPWKKDSAAKQKTYRLTVDADKRVTGEEIEN